MSKIILFSNIIPTRFYIYIFICLVSGGLDKKIENDIEPDIKNSFSFNIELNPTSCIKFDNLITENKKKFLKDPENDLREENINFLKEKLEKKEMELRKKKLKNVDFPKVGNLIQLFDKLDNDAVKNDKTPKAYKLKKNSKYNQFSKSSN
ncbi:hypothetical protein GVAV_003458 [Gurleya vavrai]